MDVSQNTIANMVTLLLGLCIGASMLGGNFLKWDTILVFLLGFLAISLDTVTGVLLGKLMRVLSKGKINPLLGAAGTSAFPMSARVVQKEGQKANPRSFLLWHAVGANTGGQIGSVMAAAVMLAIMSGLHIGPLRGKNSLYPSLRKRDNPSSPFRKGRQRGFLTRATGRDKL